MNFLIIVYNYIISLTKHKYLTSKYLEHEKIRLLRNLQTKIEMIIKSYLFYINQFLSNSNIPQSKYFRYIYNKL